MLKLKAKVKIQTTLWLRYRGCALIGYHRLQIFGDEFEIKRILLAGHNIRLLCLLISLVSRLTFSMHFTASFELI